MTIQQTTVENFCAEVGGTQPVPAGVSISAVSASFALALLAKVLDITSKRRNFGGDRVRIAELINAAREESAGLGQLANDDVKAFQKYLARNGDDDAATDAIEVPMRGARAAVRGLDLCAEGAAMVHGLTAADLAIAATLLCGAVKAMLISVDFNVRHLVANKEFADRIFAERHELESQALRRDDVVVSAVRALLAS